MARAARRRHPLHVLRVVVQIACLAAFLALLVQTARGTFVAAHPYLARLFLATDPLILVGAALAGAFSAGMLWAVAVLVLSCLAPRAYCGWICPLGTTMDVVDWLLFRKRDRSANRAPGLRKVKYGVLALVLVLSMFGLGVFGWFDPVCIATRSYGLALHPMADHAAKASLAAAEARGVEAAADVYDWALSARLLALDSDFKEGSRAVTYEWGWVFAALVVAILASQAYQKRFWCRNVCPLGALLAVPSLFGRLRPRVGEACTACDACRRRCKMGAFEADAEAGGYRAVVTECITCYACEREFCPVEAIHVGVGPGGGWRRDSSALPSRRAFLGAAAAGAVAGPALLLDQRTRAKAESNPMFRPPGALRPDGDFLAACVRCGECMKVCPTNALHPSGVENGVAGLWTPTFVFNIGYCDLTCAVGQEGGDADASGPAEGEAASARRGGGRRRRVWARGRTANLCATVCPTGAIVPLTFGEKRAWKIGTAAIDHDLCLPWARGESCLTCEEQCPLPEKAISHRTEDVPNNAWLAMPQTARHRYEQLDAKGRDGGLTRAEQAELDAMPPKTVPLARPYVLRDRCIGCGTCENVCPVNGPSAIHVGRLLER